MISLYMACQMQLVAPWILYNTAAICHKTQEGVLKKC